MRRGEVAKAVLGPWKREERRRRGVPTTSPRKATDKRMSIN